MWLRDQVTVPQAVEVTGHDLEGTGDIDLQSRDSLECPLPPSSQDPVRKWCDPQWTALSISMNAIKVNSRQACLEAHLPGDSRSYQLALTLMPPTPNKQT